jgi:REP element-mobilizing transposase RayT
LEELAAAAASLSSPVSRHGVSKRGAFYEKELKKHFWKERTFWSDGYFCCTIGNASQETIRQYIESQG